MPTVSVGRDRLFAALERSYTEDEFQELCFAFGIELDEVTTEGEMLRKMERKDGDEEKLAEEEVIFRIEVPANRYDLLCFEGIATALRVFLGMEDAPSFVVDPPRLTMTARPEVALVRPFVVCAILRDISLDEATYKSFIDLQERLHQNLCRKRTLVAIGTHDLDTLTAPFTYEALPPELIRFVPLKHAPDEEFNAVELFSYYRTEEAGRQLKKFLPIIEASPVYPVIYDANRTVCSLPPIINGAHSAISLATRNIFIECTATDLTKAHVVLDTVCTMFARYCAVPNHVEAVTVVDCTGRESVTPRMATRKVSARVDYINTCIGVNLPAEEMATLLTKMQLEAVVEKEEEEEGKDMKENGGGGEKVTVKVPPTRSDILHACDVMEDVAIAYGFNNIKLSVPQSATVGREQPLNHIADLIRGDVAMAGYTEMLTWALQSRADNYDKLRRVEDTSATSGGAVVIGNPKTAEFQECRVSLLGGALKTLGENKKAPLPLRLFELSDVVMTDSESDVGARNERRLVAVFSNSKGAGFEHIHGLLDRFMTTVGVKHKTCLKGGGGGGEEGGEEEMWYTVAPPSAEEEDGAFFPGRQAQVLFKGKAVGVFGVVHPEVLQNYDIVSPTSALEINIEPFVFDQFGKSVL